MERFWPTKLLPPVATVFAEPSERQDFVSRERNSNLFQAFFPYLYFCINGVRLREALLNALPISLLHNLLSPEISDIGSSELFKTEGLIHSAKSQSVPQISHGVS